MIIRLFRSRFYAQYLVLMLLTLLLWADVLLQPELIAALQPGFSQQWLNAWVSAHPLPAIIASVILLFLQALLLNQILENYRLTGRNQLLTAALYILMMSSAPVLVQPNAFIVVNFLMILLLYRMFNFYGNNEPYSTVFDAGIITGIASLIYFPVIYFVVFIWLGLILYLNFNWRTWLISIIALLTPYLFIAVWFYWQGTLAGQTAHFISNFTVKPAPQFHTDSYVYFIWPLFALLVLTGFGRVLRSITENTIEVRKNFRLLIIFLVFAGITVIFSGVMLKFHLMLTLIPLTAFLSAYLSQARKIFWSEIIVALIMITIFAGKLARLF